MIKLTKPQREFLELVAASDRGVYAIAYHPPVKKLLALGLIEEQVGTCRWRATDAGMAVVRPGALPVKTEVGR